MRLFLSRLTALLVIGSLTIDPGVASALTGPHGPGFPCSLTTKAQRFSQEAIPAAGAWALHSFEMRTAWVVREMSDAYARQPIAAGTVLSLGALVSLRAAAQGDLRTAVAAALGSVGLLVLMNRSRSGSRSAILAENSKEGLTSAADERLENHFESRQESGKNAYVAISRADLPHLVRIRREVGKVADRIETDGQSFDIAIAHGLANSLYWTDRKAAYGHEADDEENAERLAQLFGLVERATEARLAQLSRSVKFSDLEDLERVGAWMDTIEEFLESVARRTPVRQALSQASAEAAILQIENILPLFTPRRWDRDVDRRLCRLIDTVEALEAPLAARLRERYLSALVQVSASAPYSRELSAEAEDSATSWNAVRRAEAVLTELLGWGNHEDDRRIAYEALLRLSREIGDGKDRLRALYPVVVDPVGRVDDLKALYEDAFENPVGITVVTSPDGEPPLLLAYRINEGPALQRLAALGYSSVIVRGYQASLEPSGPENRFLAQGHGHHLLLGFSASGEPRITWRPSGEQKLRYSRLPEEIRLILADAEVLRSDEDSTVALLHGALFQTIPLLDSTLSLAKAAAKLLKESLHQRIVFAEYEGPWKQRIHEAWHSHAQSLDPADLIIVPQRPQSVRPAARWETLIYIDDRRRIVIHEAFLEWLEKHTASKEDFVEYLNHVIGHECFERQHLSGGIIGDALHQQAFEAFPHSRTVSEWLLGNKDERLPGIHPAAAPSAGSALAIPNAPKSIFIMSKRSRQIYNQLPRVLSGGSYSGLTLSCLSDIRDAVAVFVASNPGYSLNLILHRNDFRAPADCRVVLRAERLGDSEHYRLWLEPAPVSETAVPSPTEMALWRSAWVAQMKRTIAAWRQGAAMPQSGLRWIRSPESFLEPFVSLAHKVEDKLARTGLSESEKHYWMERRDHLAELADFLEAVTFESHGIRPLRIVRRGPRLFFYGYSFMSSLGPRYGVIGLRLDAEGPLLRIFIHSGDLPENQVYSNQGMEAYRIGGQYKADRDKAELHVDAESLPDRRTWSPRRETSIVRGFSNAAEGALQRLDCLIHLFELQDCLERRLGRRNPATAKVGNGVSPNGPLSQLLRQTYELSPQSILKYRAAAQAGYPGVEEDRQGIDGLREANRMMSYAARLLFSEDRPSPEAEQTAELFLDGAFRGLMMPLKSELDQTVRDEMLRWNASLVSHLRSLRGIPVEKKTVEPLGVRVPPSRMVKIGAAVGAAIGMLDRLIRSPRPIGPHELTAQILQTAEQPFSRKDPNRLALPKEISPEGQNLAELLEAALREVWPKYAMGVLQRPDWANPRTIIAQIVGSTSYLFDKEGRPHWASMKWHGENVYEVDEVLYMPREWVDRITEVHAADMNAVPLELLLNEAINRRLGGHAFLQVDFGFLPDFHIVSGEGDFPYHPANWYFGSHGRLGAVLTRASVAQGGALETYLRIYLESYRKAANFFQENISYLDLKAAKRLVQLARLRGNEEEAQRLLGLVEQFTNGASALPDYPARRRRLARELERVEPTYAEADIPGLVDDYRESRRRASGSMRWLLGAVNWIRERMGLPRLSEDDYRPGWAVALENSLVMLLAVGPAVSVYHSSGSLEAALLSFANWAGIFFVVGHFVDALWAWQSPRTWAAWWGTGGGGIPEAAEAMRSTMDNVLASIAILAPPAVFLWGAGFHVWTLAVAAFLFFLSHGLVNQAAVSPVPEPFRRRIAELERQGFRFRRAVPSDKAEIIELYAHAFRTGDTESFGKSLDASLNDSGDVYHRTPTLVVEERGRIVGMGMRMAMPGSREAKLHTLAVDAAHQGLGIGKALIGKRIQHIVEEWPEVRWIHLEASPGGRTHGLMEKHFGLVGRLMTRGERPLPTLEFVLGVPPRGLSQRFIWIGLGMLTLVAGLAGFSASGISAVLLGAMMPIGRTGAIRALADRVVFESPHLSESDADRMRTTAILFRDQVRAVSTLNLFKHLFQAWPKYPALNDLSLLLFDLAMNARLASHDGLDLEISELRSARGNDRRYLKFTLWQDRISDEQWGKIVRNYQGVQANGLRYLLAIEQRLLDGAWFRGGWGLSRFGTLALRRPAFLRYTRHDGGMTTELVVAWPESHAGPGRPRLRPGVRSLKTAS